MSLVITVTDDVVACQSVRYAVFVEEQGVSLEDEQDGQDPFAHHILASYGGQPVGAARILVQGDTGKIGRVCVLTSHRQKGIGGGLIRACLAHLRATPGIARAELGAQTHASAFYESLGFQAIGLAYEEINTPHQKMEHLL
ncbi:MAG: GNAT family N-acetyltransferase [Roseovarius sp.]